MYFGTDRGCRSLGGQSSLDVQIGAPPAKLKKNLAVIISQYYAILLLQEVGGLARWGPAHKGRAGSTEYKQDGAQTEGAQAQHHTVPRAVE